MIVWYFCRRFLRTFLLILIILTCVLSVVNVVSKNIFSSSDLVIALFLGAIPFLAAFVYPFALLCGCLFELYAAQQRGDFALINFFLKLRQQLVRSIVLSMFLASAAFVPLVCWFAPRSYDWGKQLLYSVVEQKFLTLTPGVLHFPVPGIATYFDEMKQQGSITEFHNFFLVQEDTKIVPRVVTSVVWGERVFLSDKKLWLEKGAVVGIDKKKADPTFVAMFDHGLLDLRTLFVLTKKFGDTPVKYQTISELWGNESSSAKIERYKRYFQIAWVLVTPLVAYLLSLTLIVQKIAWILLTAGGWFFMLYLILLSLPVLLGISSSWLYLLFLIPILGMSGYFMHRLFLRRK
jgi:lipopolysaccharide export LptBFGC system permease protein LptF